MFKDEQFKYEDIFKVAIEDEESIKEAAKKVRLAGEAARKCLTLQEFQIYTQQFEKAQEAIVIKMIQYTKAFFESEHGDMTKYGANMARFITKIQDLRVLLDRVNSDAKSQT
jgi:hypothetical protein